MGFFVPWAVEKSEHSARLFRRAFQQFVGAGSGIAEPGDLKVQALATPSTSIRVAPGAGMAQSRDSAATARETYGPVNDSEIVVSVPGTGSAGGRRDLVILEITDPQMSSVTYPSPADPDYTGGWLDGDTFCKITVIQNVDSLVPAAQRPVRSLDQITTGDYANVTGITLAAINWPASTTTVTNAIIQDLRQVQAPKSKPFKVTYALSGDEVDPVTATSAFPAGGETWPIQAEAAGQLLVPIPEWATHVLSEITMYGVRFDGGNASGNLWLRVGANTGLYVSGQDTGWDSDGVTSKQRVTMGVAAKIAIPAAMRGTTQQFRPRATRTAGTNATTARLDRISSFVIDGMFIQEAV